jgi:hypothetical protein
VIKIATAEDVRYVAERMRPHDAAERLALSHGNDPVACALGFLALPHLAVTVWKGTPIAVIGVVFPHPGVASTIFFATDQFNHVALATTRFIRRKLFPILVSTGIHRLQVCSMDGPEGTHSWIEGFGARQEAFLYQYGRNGEDFRLFTLSKAGMARVTSVAN